MTEIEEKYRLKGMALLNGENKVIGAWVTYTEKDGTVPIGTPGYSLNAKDREQVTGLQWPEYSQKRSAKD